MNLQKAQDLCLQMMEKHGLTKDKGWSFEWIRSKRTAGRCRYFSKTINYSKVYTGGIISLSNFVTEHHSEAEVLDTILHEIAHGLTPGHHHDWVWQRKAIEIGSNGKRCYDVSGDLEEAHKATAKIIGTCPKCSKVFPKTRMPKNDLWCKCTNRRFKQEEKISFVENNNIKTTISQPVIKTKTKVKVPKNVTSNKPDVYKNMLDKFEKQFLPLINNSKQTFHEITKHINSESSWRVQNREVRKACNKYMFDNKLMSNQKFQEMFFYEGTMNGRTIHGAKAPWINGTPN